MMNLIKILKPVVDASNTDGNKNLQNIQNAGNSAESYETIPEFDIPAEETFADIPKLKKEIIYVCEEKGGEATLAKVMENKTFLDLAQNFWATLSLAEEGILKFDFQRKQKEPIKPDELKLKLKI